jgi:hypothetical protein
LTAGKLLPAEVLEQILAKTDGVPQFVEELLRLGLLVDACDQLDHWIDRTSKGPAVELSNSAAASTPRSAICSALSSTR